MIIENLEKYSPRQLEEELLKLCYQTNAAEQNKIRLQNKYLSLKNIKEEKLAELCLGIEGKSQTEKARLALGTHSWKEFKESLINSELDFNLSNLDFKTKAREWETCRSIMSSRNSERRSGV